MFDCLLHNRIPGLTDGSSSLGIMLTHLGNLVNICEGLLANESEGLFQVVGSRCFHIQKHTTNHKSQSWVLPLLAQATVAKTAKHRSSAGQQSWMQDWVPFNVADAK